MPLDLLPGISIVFHRPVMYKKSLIVFRRPIVGQVYNIFLEIIVGISEKVNVAVFFEIVVGSEGPLVYHTTR